MTEREARHLMRNLESALLIARELLMDDSLPAKRRAMTERILAEVLDRIERAESFMNADERRVLIEEEAPWTGVGHASRGAG